MRHCDYFLIFAKAAPRRLRGPSRPNGSRRVEADLDNLRAAIALALDGGVDPVIAVKYRSRADAFPDVARLLDRRPQHTCAPRWRFRPCRLDARPRACALRRRGALADDQSDYAEAGTDARGMPRAAPRARQPARSPATLSTLAQVRLHEGDAESARASEEEALGIFRKLGDRIGEAIGLLHLGEICM